MPASATIASRVGVIVRYAGAVSRVRSHCRASSAIPNTSAAAPT
jgi:hypothetical protein